GPLPRVRLSRRGLVQLGQLAGRIERRELLEAANRTLVDEDLRHGAPAGALYDLLAEGIVVADVDLLERDATRLEQALSPDAERTARGGVDLHAGHTWWLVRAFRRGKRALAPLR